MLSLLDYFYRLIPGNPILLRVVQAAGKRKRDFFIRCGYLLLLAGFVCLSIITGGELGDLTKAAQASGALFRNLSYIQLGLVALLSPIFTAGAITQEQDSQTYDILLSTPLTNGQIVLGSMLSRVFFIFALLVSGIPIFSITQVFGGVAISSIVTSFGIACATALVTGSLAMAIAAFKVGTRRTIFAFYLFIVVFLVGGYFLDGPAYFHPILEMSEKTTVIKLADIKDFPEDTKPEEKKVGDRITATTIHNALRPTGDNTYTSVETSVSRAKTSWFTGINPFLALRVVLNDPDYVPPQMGALPADLRGWPESWYLTKPDSFYISLMFFLSFVLVMPSILLLRRVAQASTGLRRAVLMFLRLSSGDRTRKPRPVWSNPIAWREAKTKASAARATVIRYGFMALGLLGALLLIYYSSRTQPVANFVLPDSYNPAEHTLTVYNSMRNSAETYRTRDPSRPGTSEPALRVRKRPATFEELRIDGKLQAAVAVDRAGRLVSVELTDLAPMLDDATARQYLLALVILEFAGILLIVTNAAASTVTREKEDGTLDLLLSTPITSRYYIWGKLRGLVSFVTPLVAIPVISVLLFVLVDIARAVAGSNRPTTIFPESVLVIPGTMLIVAALGAIMGMHMSLRSRTTVWAVMTSVGIMAGICFGLGGCGFVLMDHAAGEVGGGLGVTVACFSPFTLISMLIDPLNRAKAAFGAEGGADVTNRVLMFIFGWVATVGYGVLVWAMYKSMVRNFDMTIRRQTR